MQSKVLDEIHQLTDWTNYTDALNSTNIFCNKHCLVTKIISLSYTKSFISATFVWFELLTSTQPDKQSTYHRFRAALQHPTQLSPPPGCTPLHKFTPHWFLKQQDAGAKPDKAQVWTPLLPYYITVVTRNVILSCQSHDSRQAENPMDSGQPKQEWEVFCHPS